MPRCYCAWNALWYRAQAPSIPIWGYTPEDTCTSACELPHNRPQLGREHQCSGLKWDSLGPHLGSGEEPPELILREELHLVQPLCLATVGRRFVEQESPEGNQGEGVRNIWGHQLEHRSAASFKDWLWIWN